MPWNTAFGEQLNGLCTARQMQLQGAGHGALGNADPHVISGPLRSPPRHMRRGIHVLCTTQRRKQQQDQDACVPHTRSYAEPHMPVTCTAFIHSLVMEPVIDPAKAELEDRLRRVFPDIYEPEARRALVAQGRQMELGAGEVFLDIGGYIRDVPLVLSGLLKLERMDDEGNELLLYYLRPGETCAMSLTCCTSEARSTIRVTAEEDSELLAIPARIMDRLTEEHRSWKHFVMLTYQRRFDELLRTIDGVAFQNLDSRIVELLKNRARNTGSRVLSVTHQELAEQLNSSREVVSRLLKRMEREGALKLGRQRIELLGMDHDR